MFDLTGIRPTELKKQILRCENTHPDGRAYGYRGLVPDQKTVYFRSSPETLGLAGGRGKAGLFTGLMEAHKENLRDYVEDLFVRGKKLPNGAWQLLSPDEIYDLFIERCRLLLKPSMNDTGDRPYPFSTDDQGRRSLYRMLNAIATRNPERFIGRLYGEDSATAFNSDAIGRSLPKAARLLDRIQLDGHRIDAEGVVAITEPSGMPSYALLSDVWSVDWTTVAKSIPFGHHLALTGTYNRYDVLRSIASGLGVLKPESGLLKYLPVHFVPELEWACFDKAELDRALAHLAEEVMDVLEGTINAQVEFGEAHTPRKRPHIERFYSELESRGFRRIPSSHRPGNSKVAREKAMKRAMDFKIDWFDLEEIAKRSDLPAFFGPR